MPLGTPLGMLVTCDAGREDRAGDEATALIEEVGGREGGGEREEGGEAERGRGGEGDGKGGGERGRSGRGRAKEEDGTGKSKGKAALKRVEDWRPRPCPAWPREVGSRWRGWESMWVRGSVWVRESMRLQNCSVVCRS